MKQNECIAILTASSGLGSFIPAVTLSHYLQSLGYRVELCCIEKIYHEKAIARFKQTQRLCQQDMRAAKLAQQLIDKDKTDILSATDPYLWKSLIQEWQNNKTKKFIIFSGFWLPLLTEFITQTSDVFSFDAIHMDAIHASSWKRAHKLPNCQHIWLFQAKDQQISALTPLRKVNNWQQRNDRVACHGGGWHIGNVKSPIDELSQRHIATLSYVSHPPGNITDKLQQYIQIQEDWQPWLHGCENGGVFPPQTCYTYDKTIASSGNSHFFQQQVELCRGIVTKPGGGSLLDSLTTATPLILLPAYGSYEQANGEVWLKHGFAITYEQWKQQQFDWKSLEKLHENLFILQQTLVKENSHYAP